MVGLVGSAGGSTEDWHPRNPLTEFVELPTEQISIFRRAWAFARLAIY